MIMKLLLRNAHGFIFQTNLNKDKFHAFYPSCAKRSFVFPFFDLSNLEAKRSQFEGSHAEKNVSFHTSACRLFTSNTQFCSTLGRRCSPRGFRFRFKSRFQKIVPHYSSGSPRCKQKEYPSSTWARSIWKRRSQRHLKVNIASSLQRWRR